MSLSKTLAYGVLCLLSLGVGAYSLSYALPGPPWAPPLPNLVDQHALLVAHALTAALALLLGPLQLLPALRRAPARWHRRAGRLYASSVLLSWLASVPLAFNAQTGAVAGAGFFVLGLLWVYTTGRGMWLARQARFAEHRRWMLRSFALTGAAITLRLYIGLVIAAGVEVELAYPAIAWLCWVPNLIGVELYLRWRARTAAIAGRLLPQD